MAETLKLEVTVSQGNVKKIDPEAYGVTKRDMWVKLGLLGVEQKTTEHKNSLDCVWEEVFVFDVKDVLEDKLESSFYLGEIQIGVTATFNLDNLKKGIATYKGMAVPGGKIDLSLKALNFGKEEEEKADEGDDWMSFM
eukprot:NODE_6584_length_520_cov_13.839695_g6419_i0.p1 GENE.NODE_6584_length_520_cov_13.839695_g6419_i0~~NODE_6584_length_520_cov_13.839695_g6419_i0.p1  ORF type:complete len:138 (+),score=34.16 NODE_6584_length_520_cov_13.839695_g6419_i0:64-477(+)